MRVGIPVTKAFAAVAACVAIAGCTANNLKSASRSIVESGGFGNNTTPTGPDAPTVTSPSSATYYSNSSPLTISGACTDGLTVVLGGDSSQITACASGAYSFSVSKSSDATYNFTIAQRTYAGALSSAVSRTWVYDRVAPAAPTVTSPASNPYSSNGSSVTISGACETGATVTLSGDGTGTTTCASSAYSFTVNKSSDATYNFSLTQTDVAGNASSAGSFQWIRVTSGVPAPNVTTPASSPHYSNGSSLTLAGTCVTGDTILLTGSDTQSVACVGGAFSFTVNKSSDSTYNFTLQEQDAATNLSPTVSKQWVRDTVAPSAPTVTSPASSPYYSNGSSVTLSGACETGATVALSGADTQTTTCASSAYSFTVNKSSDGTYSFSLAQTDRAGNASGTTSFQWGRGTSTPATPAITTPASTPFYSNANSVSIIGTCTNGDTVSLAGSDTQSASCSGGGFNFSVSKGADGTYDFTVTQTDVYGNSSASASQRWVRDTAAPSAPTVTTPASNPYTSNGSSVTISGACENGATVTLAGDGTGTTTCASSAYSFTVNKSSDATYNFSLTQTDVAGNTSSATSFQWTRSTAGVPAVTVTSPATSPKYSNGSSLVISGGCVTGNTVTLGGSDSQTTTCASSAYSFTVNKTSDGTYNFTLVQDDGAGNASTAVVQQWIRDTAAPLAPTVTVPGANPYTSGDSTITISGACETAATVTLAGASSGTTTCASSSYSFSVSKSSDAAYSFTVSQTDRASNASASTSFQWVRDTTIPATPTITSPSTNPYYSNGSSVIVSGGCVATHTVTLDDGSATPPTTTCAAGNTYSFTINKSSDGTYSYNIYQTDAALNDSANVAFQWVRDTSTPSAPVITVPATTPYTASGNLTLSGTCETGTTVTLAGDDSQTTTCASSAFSFTVIKSSDATYNFSVTQTDSAGNTSSSDTQQWVRNSTVPSTPTIVTPATNPYLGKTTGLTISGGCTTGNTVTLGGNVIAGEVTSPAGSLTTTCAASSYSFTISKSSDATYTLTVKQTSPSAIDSGTASLSWTRDTVAPTTTIDTDPGTTNLAATATFTFSANESSVTFYCDLDSGGYAPCSSPVTLSSLTNGSHTFSVYAVDQAGNAGTADTFTWSQTSGNTLALYHFDTSPGATTDSSVYGTNTLTTTSTSAGASAKFSQSLSFNGSSSYASAAHNSSQALGRSTMSVEAFVKLGASLTNGQYMVIASKMGSSGSYGWEFGLKRQGSKTSMYFKGSLNGTTVTEVKSTSLTLDTTSFHHYAVTWNSGSVKFFYDGTAKGVGTIGTAGSSTLYLSTANLQIGRTQSGSSYLNGIVDECRISQIVRWTSNFTAPSAAYSTD